MKLFTYFYDKTIALAGHKNALIWINFVSFIEAIFFPIPPDVMIAPMAIAKPNQAVKIAWYVAFFSVLGGITSYAIGYFASDWTMNFITQMNWLEQYKQAQSWFVAWGVVVVFIAGFSPIPFKVFTLCAGLFQMAFLPFVLIAFISRLARYLIVANLFAWGGVKYEAKLKKYIEIIGWLSVLFVIIIYLIYKFTN